MTELPDGDPRLGDAQRGTAQRGSAQRGSAQRVAVASARAAAATIGIGVAVVAIALAVFAPIPTVAVKPAAVTVTPVVTPQQLVCPGAVLQLGNDQGQGVSKATAIAPAAISTGATVGTATAAPFGTDQGSPTLVTSAAGSAASTIVAGSQSQSAATGAISGFAAAECAPVSTDTWLVGGSTITGRTTLVTLANPSDVAATVALDVVGEKGSISAPGATGIEVAPGSQRVVSLAGFAPDTTSPVVHVTSTGGHIVANLQQYTVRGLEAGGLDIVGATTGPALSLTIPGLDIVTPDDIESRIAKNDDDADLATVVRLYVPGSVAATATIGIAPEGSSRGQSFEQPLSPGVVTDVPIQGLAAGTYTVSVKSTVPVVGAVRSAVVSTPDSGANSSDFAWFASPATIQSATAFSVAAGPSPTLHIANASSTAVTATLTAGGGSPQPIAVAAKASVSIPVIAGTTYAFSSSGAVSTSLGYSSSTQLADVPLDPRLADAEPIVVYP